MSRSVRWLFGLLLCLGMLAPAAPALADGIIVPDPPVCDGELCPGPFPMSQLAIRYHRVEVTHPGSGGDHTRRPGVPQRQRLRRRRDLRLPAAPRRGGDAVHAVDRRRAGRGQGADARAGPSDVRGHRSHRCAIRRCSSTSTEAPCRPRSSPSIPEPSGASSSSTRRCWRPRMAWCTTATHSTPRSSPHSPWKRSPSGSRSTAATRSRRSTRPAMTWTWSATESTSLLATYEATNVLPDRDFELYYSLGEDRIGVQRAELPRSREDRGRVLPAPGLAGVRRRTELDRRQGRPAGHRSVGQHGRREDRAGQAGGDLRPAPSEPRGPLQCPGLQQRHGRLCSALREADEAAEAIAWVEALSARGSTDINRALLEAAAQLDAERPALVLFLTDGLPTEGDDRPGGDPGQHGPLRAGQRAPVLVRRRIRRRRRAAGHAVRRPTTARRPTCCPTRTSRRSVSAFYAKVSTPVLTDLDLDLGDARAYDLVPEIAA